MPEYLRGGDVAATAQYAREVIHAFNERGFAALDPKWSGARPPRFGPHARELICRVARTPPQQAGLPFTTWSLTKLVEHLAAAHRLLVSTETVRQVLRAAGVRWQATKTWKASRDPEFRQKMNRILDLYDRSAAGTIPDGGRVDLRRRVRVAEPAVQPGPGRFPPPGAQHGCGRCTTAIPAGRGTCSRPRIVASGQLFYLRRDRKRWQEFLAFLPQPPGPVPAQAALRGVRQLLPAPQGRGRPLVCLSRRRNRLHTRTHHGMIWIDRVHPAATTSP